jgi:hypothetical protein
MNKWGIEIKCTDPKFAKHAEFFERMLEVYMDETFKESMVYGKGFAKPAWKPKPLECPICRKTMINRLPHGGGYHCDDCGHVFGRM